MASMPQFLLSKRQIFLAVCLGFDCRLQFANSLETIRFLLGELDVKLDLEGSDQVDVRERIPANHIA